MESSALIKFNEVVTDKNINEAYHIIRKNTIHRKKLTVFEMYYLSNIFNIKNNLYNNTYTHQSYNIFLVQEPKYRIIMSEKLYDKIINHLISKFVLKPCIEKILISSNVATRENKGTKAAINYMKYYINKLKFHTDNIYILKCDISKYFFNIDHNILFEMVNKFKIDTKLKIIIKNIIDSTDNVNSNNDIDIVVNHEKNRLLNKNIDCTNALKELNRLPRYYKGKGLPIGNMSSQLLALLYLNGLDHFIKETLHIKYYIRYMDDFLLISDNKEYLKYCLQEITKYVENKLLLKLNNKTQIYNLSKGLNFLGYRYILRDKRLLMLPTSKNKTKIRRKLKKLKDTNYPKYQLTKISYRGYFMNCNQDIEKYL